MKTETGVLVMLDGMAWGNAYQDGQSSCEGWISPEDAIISDFLKKPTDLTYSGSHYEEELSKGKIVNVVRETRIIIK